MKQSSYLNLVLVMFIVFDPCTVSKVSRCTFTMSSFILRLAMALESVWRLDAVSSVLARIRSTVVHF